MGFFTSKAIKEKFRRTKKTTVKRCNMESPSGTFLCEKPAGHEGPHTEEVTHTWD